MGGKAHTTFICKTRDLLCDESHNKSARLHQKKIISFYAYFFLDVFYACA